jgi:hypothetical protein
MIMSSRKSKQGWLKQLQKRKQKRFEALKSNLAQGPLPIQEFVIEPAGKEKMSEVLEDFIEPYRDTVDGEDDYRKLLTIALIAWNAALMPEGQRAAMIDDLLSAGMPPGSDDLLAELRSLVNLMVERKLTHFATNRRAIVSFEVRDTGRNFHLSVASTPDDLPPS